MSQAQEIVEISTPAQSNVASMNPAGLLQIAVQQGADLDKLERLMALQERWEATEARKAYDAAFAAFKAEAVTIIKSRMVDAGPLSGKKYAELYAVVNAVTPALSKHGLSSAWKITKDDKDWIEVTCTIKHIGGHSESVSMGGPPDAGGAKNPIQARASTVSYLERYTLKAITGLSEQDDDNDGGAGQTDDGLPDETLQAGRDAAMQGTDVLTTWWGQLNAKQRSKYNADFGNLKKVARQADQGAGHG